MLNLKTMNMPFVIRACAFINFLVSNEHEGCGTMHPAFFPSRKLHFAMRMFQRGFSTSTVMGVSRHLPNNLMYTLHWARHLFELHIHDLNDVDKPILHRTLSPNGKKNHARLLHSFFLQDKFRLKITDNAR